MIQKIAMITEVFSTTQGEGLLAGIKQIFVRFFGCNMNCIYCDEKKKVLWQKVNQQELLKRVDDINRAKGPHHSVALTGGEPLLYAEFLKDVLPVFKKNGLKTYLETNGTMPDKIEELLGLVDIIAMDIKPPSVTKDIPFWNEHEKFLKIASRADVFVKVVINNNILPQEMEKVIKIIANIDKTIPFILQPIDGAFEGMEGKMLQMKFQKFKWMAEEKLESVRVIPQLHKILGLK